jgi:hypothetical protein
MGPDRIGELQGHYQEARDLGEGLAVQLSVLSKKQKKVFGKSGLFQGELAGDFHHKLLDSVAMDVVRQTLEELLYEHPVGDYFNRSDFLSSLTEEYDSRTCRLNSGYATSLEAYVLDKVGVAGMARRFEELYTGANGREFERSAVAEALFRRFDLNRCKPTWKGEALSISMHASMNTTPVFPADSKVELNKSGINGMYQTLEAFRVFLEYCGASDLTPLDEQQRAWASQSPAKRFSLREKFELAPGLTYQAFKDRFAFTFTGACAQEFMGFLSAYGPGANRRAV